MRKKNFLLPFSCLFIFAALALVGCEKKEPPPTLDDDIVLKKMSTQIASLEEDLKKMEARIDGSRVAMEDNALRPKALDMFRKERFKFDKLARQIDQEISYLKIRKSLRERDLSSRLDKLTLKDLEAEAEDYELSVKALNKHYVWRDMPLPEPYKKEAPEKEKAPEEK
ncbi:MAG: hypothetical protein H6623_03505 [Bdellovibrionaceae bacterium]|nr:hypothetical protein [Pseudobdellovibrionaceae bacterium]